MEDTAQSEPSIWKEGHSPDHGSGEPSPPQDSVKLYFNEIGTVPLLDREAELRLARQIESGNRRVKKALSRTPWLWQRLGALERQLKANELNVRPLLDLKTTDSARSGKAQAVRELRRKLRRITRLVQEFEKLSARSEEALARLAELMAEIGSG